MKGKKQLTKTKGGIESIVAVVIFVSLVVILLISNVIKPAQTGKEALDGGVAGISALENQTGMK